MTDPLLDEGSLAKALKVSPRTVENWRRTGEGPPYFYLTARTVRYRQSDVDAWLEQRRAQSTVAHRSMSGRSEAA